MTFQTNDFCVPLIESSLQLCLWSISELSTVKIVLEQITNQWHKFEKYVSEFKKEDEEKVRNLCKLYCNALSEALYDRFPNAATLTSFRAIDLFLMSKEMEKRKQFGEQQIKKYGKHFNFPHTGL